VTTAMTTKRLLPQPTVDEVVAELRIRIAANRKSADEAKRGEWKKQEYVCQRTAQELERIVFWITGE
jgi:hypothetical protein